MKIGDIVVANRKTPYGITTNGWAGKIIRISNDSSHICVQSIKEDDKAKYEVESCYFKLLNTRAINKPAWF